MDFKERAQRVKEVADELDIDPEDVIASENMEELIREEAGEDDGDSPAIQAATGGSTGGLGTLAGDRETQENKVAQHMKRKGLIDDNSRSRAFQDKSIKAEDDEEGQTEGSTSGIRDPENYTGEEINPPLDLQGLAELFDSDPTHRACSVVKAKSTVLQGYRFVPLKHRDVSSDESAPDELRELFWDINPDKELGELLENFLLDFITTGNGWLEIERNMNGGIANLYHLPATHMRILTPAYQEQTGFYAYQEYNREKTYFRKPIGPEEDYQAIRHEGEIVNEVIHMKKYSPASQWYGQPDIVSVIPNIIGNQLSRENTIDFFERKGVPPYALFIRGADFEDHEEHKSVAQRFFNKSLQQENSQIMIMTFEPGVEEVDLEELETDVSPEVFDEYRDTNRDEISRVHRVPPRLINVTDSSSMGGGSEGQSQMEQFVNFVVNPLQRKVQKQLYKKVIRISNLPDSAMDWQLEFESPSVRSLESMANTTTSLIQNGIYSINEARQEIGRDPLDNEGADRRVFLLGGQPMGIDSPTDMESAKGLKVLGTLDKSELADKDLEEKIRKARDEMNRYLDDEEGDEDGR